MSSSSTAAASSTRGRRYGRTPRTKNYQAQPNNSTAGRSSDNKGNLAAPSTSDGSSAQDCVSGGRPRRNESTGAASASAAGGRGASSRGSLSRPSSSARSQRNPPGPPHHRRRRTDRDRRRTAGAGTSTQSTLPASLPAVSERETQDQNDEMMALTNIFDPSVLRVAANGFGGRFRADVHLPRPFFLTISRRSIASDDSVSTVTESAQDLERIPVRFLPPISLYFSLPNAYPSAKHPRFRLYCRWLTSDQLSSLSRRLEDIWHEEPGEVVLFKWTGFLQEDALDHLGIRADTLNLSWISDVSVAPASSAAVLQEILEFDERRREEEFRYSNFKCNVCFEERVGAKCMRFKNCEHVFCKDCMKSYFEVQIGDGNVMRLSCPSDKCSSQALPSQVLDLVGPELFAKYDRMLLTTTLDSMNDVTYCPRDSCQCAVLFEPGSTLATCPSCRYVFCIFCLMAYHGIEPCKLKLDERLKLFNKYTDGDAAEKARLEARYGRNQLRRLVEATLSDTWLKENSKCCPRCRAQIEKLDGCNKMTCSKCNSYFCWLCMQHLDHVNPYRHYEKGACSGMLFHGTEPHEDDLYFEEDDDDDDDDDDDFDIYEDELDDDD